VLFNTRPARPGERDGVDYHFRPRPIVEALSADPRYALVEARGDLQAVDLTALAERLQHGDALFEGNPFVAGRLIDSRGLAAVPRLTIFVSPLSAAEISEVRRSNLASFVAQLMRGKLERRTMLQKGAIGPEDRATIERRAASALAELGHAHRFSHVIVNHDGEDSDHWRLGVLVGDARQSLATLIALLEGRAAPAAERWGGDTIPEPAGA
jgi:guanylate kinase